ncbi:hypothetical protein J6590_013018 [Homalodisca vitripennis]|nr:hypothetical protein J6590_013018 [Homalodisca vitripennis]
MFEISESDHLINTLEEWFGFIVGAERKSSATPRKWSDTAVSESDMAAARAGAALMIDDISCREIMDS